MESPGFRAGLLGVSVIEAGTVGSVPCPGGEAAFRDLLEAELAMSSTPADPRAVTWYATLADIAASGDLGFTAGPWAVSAGDAPAHGQFLSVWRRDSMCGWQLTVDAGIAFGGPAAAEDRVSPDHATRRASNAPPALLIEEDAIGQAASDFWRTCREDGVAAGLRTYARNGDFLLLAEHQAPMGLKQADLDLTQSELSGNWQESDRGRSADGTLAFSTGSLFDEQRRLNRPGVQIWQFDPKVSNWGVRILLLGAAAAVSK
jgi:hypothetical protein